MKTKILTLIAFLFAYINSYSQSGMIACFNFNQNTKNSIPAGLNGINNGAIPTLDRFGFEKNAYLFNGSSSINLQSDFDFPNRTISFWFNSSSISSQGNIIFDADHPNIVNGTTKIAVKTGNGVDSIRCAIGRSSSVFTHPIMLNQWYHIAVTVSPLTVNYYLNGVLKQTDPFVTTVGSPNGNTFVRFGSSRVNDRHFNGSLDDLKIFNSELNSNEVFAIYSEDFCESCKTLIPATNVLQKVYSCYNLNLSFDDYGPNASNANGFNISGASNRYNQPNKAFSFNGVSSYLDLNDDFDLPNRTINIWFNSRLASGVGLIYDSDNANLQNGNTKIRVLYENGIQVLRLSVGQTTSSSFSIPVDTNQWHMATISYSNQFAKFYFDGCLMGEVSVPIFSNSSNGNTAIIGSSRILDRFFVGDIDDITIYDTTLTHSEVKSLYDSNFVCPPPISTSINENSKSTILSVYPNPFKDEFLVSFDPSDKKYQLFNSLGTLIYEKNVLDKQIKISLNDYPSGIYFLRVIGVNYLKSQTLIKSN